MNYYILINGQQNGPYPENELLSRGLTPQTPVWAEGMPDWQNAGTLPSLAYLFNPSYGVTPPAPSYAPGMNTQQPFPPKPPKNWLVESILVTLFCCLPFGIVGIIKASSVNSLFNAGNYQGAEEASKDAGKWTKIGFFCGIIVSVLYVIFILIAGVGSAFSGNF